MALTGLVRAVCLMHEELFEELRGAGFEVSAGQLGEKHHDARDTAADATSRHAAADRAYRRARAFRPAKPCLQLDRFQAGLMQAVLDRDADGNLVRKAGVMAIVLTDGEVQCGDEIKAELPPEPHRPLAPV